jgi:hypothetical protein
LAAILAIGKPVALEASAEERDTRGFISMTIIRPSAGLTANCTFEPPVSTPILRRYRDRGVAHALIFLVGQRLRRRHGDRIAGVDAHRVEVLDRADDDAVVALSRTTSISNSFQPSTDSSISTSRGRGIEAARRRARSNSSRL